MDDFLDDPDLTETLDDQAYLQQMDAVEEDDDDIPSEEEVSNHDYDQHQKEKKTEEEEMKEEEEHKDAELAMLYGFKMPKNEVYYRKQLKIWEDCDTQLDHKGRLKPLPHLKPIHPFNSAKLLPRVWMDVSVGDKPLGRLIFILFPSVAPRACENFRCLCTGEKGLGKSGNPLHFKHTHFFKNITHFFCQGGDTTVGDGTGGESIWGSPFKDEICHGTVKMNRGNLITANSGPNTNRSQFCILFDEAEWLEDKSTVFGILDEGQDVLYMIENAGMASEHIDPTTHTPTRNAPKSPYKQGGETHPLLITDCGQLILIETKTMLDGKRHYGHKWKDGKSR